MLREAYQSNSYVEKQARKHCKVLLILIHIIYYLSWTLLGKCYSLSLQQNSANG